MEQSPPETHILRADEEIPRPLWNKKSYYRVHNSSQLAPILSQMNPIHIYTSYYFKINFNIILSSTYQYPNWYLSFKFPD